MTDLVWIIYCITCSVNGKQYIGLTSKTLERRWCDHRGAAKAKEQSPLYRAMRKYGFEAFRIFPITECYSFAEANACERGIIAERGTLAKAGRGYNASIGGQKAYGWNWSEESRRKKSEAKKGKFTHFQTPETRAKQAAWHTGKKLSEETKAKIRACKIGRKRSPESCAKQAETMRRNNAHLRLLKQTSPGGSA